jgi:hypothetical protein
MVADVERHFIGGKDPRSEPSGLLSTDARFYRRRVEEFKEFERKMNELSESFHKAAFAANDLKLVLEPLPKEEVFLKATVEADLAVRHDAFSLITKGLVE